MSTTLLASEVRSHPDLLQYQEGAVVSRILLKEKSGNITLFAFDAGEGLSEHTCPYNALVYAVDGAGEIDLGGETYPLETGDVLTLPAGIPHAVRAVKRFKMLLIMIRRQDGS